jgi:hypothetical protein
LGHGVGRIDRGRHNNLISADIIIPHFPKMVYKRNTGSEQ